MTDVMDIGVCADCAEEARMLRITVQPLKDDLLDEGLHRKISGSAQVIPVTPD